MPRIALHTLGCKLNAAETAAIGRQFLELGYEVVEFGQPADVCLINTCTVTERADRECRQVIRRALRTSADPVVIVTGCYAQLRPEEVASIPGVDLVLGTREKSDVPAHMGEPRKNGGPRVIVGDFGSADDFGPAMTSAADGRTRAFLKIQDGCDYTCSFCTIPRARGSSRSQAIEACVRQAEQLVAGGYREIVLTGVNVGDYGRKMGTDLHELLRALTRVDGLQRLRVSSIEPNLLTDEIIDLVASHPVLCPHFHIPLQSGDDTVLGLMRRRYRTREYAGRIERIRKVLPDAGIGVDVIVGFPGETAGAFESTARFLADLPISYLHVFTYSERPGTQALALGNPVPRPERSRRNALLRALSQRKRMAFHSSITGTRVEVLLESDTWDGLRFGLTPSYARVAVPEDAGGENQILAVQIETAGPEFCHGRPAEVHA